MKDLQHALRSLSRAPGFAAVAVATLALGIGATTAVFSVVHAVLWSPLPFRDPDRLAILWETDPHNHSFQEGVSAPDLTDWKEGAKSFSAVAGSRSLEMNLTEPGRAAERISVAAVSHEFLALFGVRPAFGRDLGPADDRQGAPGVVLLSQSLWRSRYGGSRDVLGKTIALDGRATAVVGVLPAGFDFPGRVDAWVALRPANEALWSVRGVHNLMAVARLKDGVSFEAAGAEMAGIAARLARAIPDDNAGRGARVQPLTEAVVGDFRRELYVLLAAVLFVTLIACANVSGLLLARARAREREIAIRRALGAGRARLAFQVLAEASWLALAGGAGGLLLAAWGTQGLVALSPEAVPRMSEIRLDPRVLLFTLAASLAAGFASALAPVLRLLRGREVPLDRAGWSRVSGDRMPSALVVGQVALACILATGAGLLLVTLRNLRHVDPGFRPEGLLTAELQLPKSTYPEPARVEDFYTWPEVLRFFDALLPSLAALPGAEAASLALNHPLKPGWTSQIEIEGQPQKPGARDEVYIRPVAPGYFRTVGSPLRRGRDLDAGDRQGAPNVLVVNETFARRYFGSRDPLGRTVSFWDRPRQIVGVVGDVRFRGLAREAAPAVYPSLLQVPMSSLSLVVRAPAGRAAASLAPALRKALSEVDPDVALFNVRTADALLAESVGSPRFRALLLALFGGVALLLSAVGLYGLLSYWVTRRTREIGIRAALGAQRRALARMVVAEGMRRCLIGVAVGTAAALAASRLLASLLYGVRPGDVRVSAAVAAVLAAASFAACSLPARRATRVEPSKALRAE